MDTDNISNIVSTILRSPEFQTSLENTVRNLNVNNANSTVTRPEASHSVRQELQRLFPTIKRTGEKNESKRKRKTQSFFCRDVILLDDPNIKCTLKGSSKSAAFEKGFGFSNVQFSCDWTHEEILKHIEHLYQQYLEGHEFEILVPIGGHLNKPRLSPDAKFDGQTMKTIFNQKTVYVRLIQSHLSEKFNTSNSIEEEETNTLETTLLFEEHSLETHQSMNMNDYDILYNDVEVGVKNNLDEKIYDSNISLQEIITNLNNQVNDQKITCFNIFREDIFNCCIRAMRRKSFCPFNKISVNFSDIEGVAEGAVDVGGPTREMFRLVLQYIKSSRLFFGNEKKYIRLNMDAVDNQEYYEAGRLIALSLIHGGPGPHFFSESLYSVLLFGISDNYPTLNDIEEETIIEKIVKLMDITEIDTLQEYLSEETIFSIAGYEYIKTMEDKNKLIEDVIHFYGFHRIRPALEQFKDGLKTGNVLMLMEKHPCFKDIMCSSPMKLTASMLENLFTTSFSELGSSKRTLENRTISFWRDFLLDCEENESDVTLKDILIFCTGADTIPPLGFNNVPIIVFLYGSEHIYPKANTCGLKLSLPTVHENFDDFKYNVSFGIQNCKDFAFV